MNKVLLFGTIGVIDVHETGANGKVLRIRLATNERVKKGDQYEDVTEWHQVVVFGKRAVGLESVLKVGGKLVIAGKNRTSKWTDKEGIERYSTEVISESVELAGPPKSK